MGKKVSVVIPIYNVEKYLGECLESVINQTLQEIEIICVNDQSTDNSLRIAKEYEEKDSRIKVISNKQNGGLSYARNVGTNYAEGEYIYYLDSDDVLEPEALKELYDVALKDNLDVVFFDSEMFFEKGIEERPIDLFCARDVYNGIITGRQFLKQCFENGDIREPVWIQFYKKDFLEKNNIRFYNGILHEDILFTFQIFMKAERMKCINTVYHKYRIRQNAITSSKCSERHIAGLAITYCEILEIWKNDEYDETIVKAINHYLDRISWKMVTYCKNFAPLELVDKELQKTPVAQKMFRILLEQRMPREQNVLYGDWANVDWDYLCSFEKIIIYGAGKIGKEALRQIGEGHSVSCFAVTNKEESLRYLMGLPVYQIDQLPDEYKDGIIAIAANRSIRKKMEETAEKLGYKNIMILPLK